MTNDTRYDTNPGNGRLTPLDAMLTPLKAVFDDPQLEEVMSDPGGAVYVESRQS